MSHCVGAEDKSSQPALLTTLSHLSSSHCLIFLKHSTWELFISIPEVLGVPVHADPQDFLLKLGREMELSYCRKLLDPRRACTVLTLWLYSCNMRPALNFLPEPQDKGDGGTHAEHKGPGSLQQAYSG